MGLLDGGLAAAFAGAFASFYLDGALYRPNAFADDGKGGGSSDGFADPEAVKVQVDAATQAMRSADNYVETDQRILVLAHGVDAIDTDCEIVARGVRWGIASVARDPAGSYYELRGQRKADA
jgi:hypothetical protein